MGTYNDTSELYLPDGIPDSQRLDIVRHHLDAARSQIRKLQSRVDELDNKCAKNELIIDDLKKHVSEASPIIENIQFWQRVGGVLLSVAAAALALYQAFPR